MLNRFLVEAQTKTAILDYFTKIIFPLSHIWTIKFSSLLRWIFYKQGSCITEKLRKKLNFSKDNRKTLNKIENIIKKHINLLFFCVAEFFYCFHLIYCLLSHLKKSEQDIDRGVRYLWTANYHIFKYMI